VKVKDEVGVVTGGARGAGTAFVDRDVSERACVVAADLFFVHAREAAARNDVKAVAVSANG